MNRPLTAGAAPQYPPVKNEMNGVSLFDAPAGSRNRVTRQTNTTYLSSRLADEAVIAREIARHPAIAESIVLQNRWRTGVDSYMMEGRLDEAAKLRRLEGEMWWEMDQFLYFYRDHFEAVVENENNNLDFYNGYQWSNAELKKLQDRKLFPIVLNTMARWARTLVGEERGAVTSPSFTTTDPAFKPRADLYNQVMPRIYRMNEWSHRSADAFFNTAVGGRSFQSSQLDPYDPTGGILMLNHRPQEFMYDMENAYDGTLDGCNYLARVVLRDLEELIHLYPEREDELRKYDMGDFAYVNLLGWTLASPKVAPTVHKRSVAVPQRFSNYPFFRHRRSVWTIEFYRRYGIKYWSVYDGNTGLAHDFEAPDQAAYFYTQIRDAYQYTALAQTGKPGPDLVAPPLIVTRPHVSKELWCGRKLLEFTSTKGNRMPYVACHNEFHNAEWKGFFQDDKQPQQIRNKMAIWWDMYLGAVKPKNFFHKVLFPKGSTQEQREEWARDPMKDIIGGDWPLDQNVGSLVHHSETPQVSQVPDIMFKIMTQTSDFANGGLNSVGDAEFAGQSDRLRRGLAVSAHTGAESLMEDWDRSEVRQAENTAYQAQFLAPQTLIGLADPKDRQSFIPLVGDGSHTLQMKEIQSQMEIVEILAGPSKRDRQNATLGELIQQDPENSQEEKLILLERSDLPESDIDRIKQSRQAQAQAAQAQQDKENQLAEYDTQEKWKIAQGRIDVENFNAGTKRNPPIAASLIIKQSPIGPDGMASVFEQHGIAAHPDLVAASGAKQILTDQAASNLQQEDFNQRDLTHQRALAKIPAPPLGQGARKKKSQGTSTPKDASARKRKGPEKT